MALKTCGSRTSLMGLPPELREAIFKYAVVDPEPIIIPKSGKLQKPGLLKVCRQVYCESGKMYYKLNKFRAIIDTNNASGPEIWIAEVPDGKASMMSSLVLEYHRAPSDLRRCTNEMSGRDHLGFGMLQKLMDAENRVKACILGLRKAGVSKEALRIELATITLPPTLPASLIMYSLEETALKLNGILAIMSARTLEVALTCLPADTAWYINAFGNTTRLNLLKVPRRVVHHQAMH